MMDLNEILLFARVVEAGSITKAAAQLKMPKSTASRKVSELEERLKTRLLHRTTRTLSVTDVGRIYYDHCARIVAEVEEAERVVSGCGDAPRGLLRVSAPVNCSFLGPIIADYLKRCPQVQLEMFFTARTVDLVAERFDVCIRAGGLADSTLVARSLGRATWFLAATPAYLKRYGSPQSPEDLALRDRVLYIADITRLRTFDADSGKPEGDIALSGCTFATT
jgi:DNA-binding transcriptional LysR family regulator